MGRKKSGAKATRDQDWQKLEPKLRMIANGDWDVNAARSERSSAIAVKPQREPKAAPKPSALQDQLQIQMIPKEAKELPGRARKASLRGTLPADVVANVFVNTSASKLVLAKHVEEIQSSNGELMTARVRLSALRKLLRAAPIDAIELGDAITAPRPECTPVKEKPDASERRFALGKRKAGARRRVLIGVIDVGGFDFTHEDFLDASGRTRWVAIWDQGADGNGPEGFSGFRYGHEISKKDMDKAIKYHEKHGGLRPYNLERQSQMDEGSHGTHVASIAAGNRGVCKEALIAGVVIAVPKARLSGRNSLFDSTRLVHAVDYLCGIAETHNASLVINISLGTNGHAHDDSSAVSRWIDHAMSVPGRAVCVAAGNAGQERPLFDHDVGDRMGRIHTSGKVPASGLSRDIDWEVVGNYEVDISENELEIWYGAQDRFAVRVKPPGGNWIDPVKPRQFIQNKQLKKSKSFVSIYNELYHPANGANYIGVYLSPYLSTKGCVGIPHGTWRVRLEGIEVRDGTYHGWIERDDPNPAGRQGDREQWSLPSYFPDSSNVDNMSVSSLACGRRIITVGNLDRAAERINATSSQGPTRDGRFKPDVVAPGTNIVAACGFSPRMKWIEMSGTSMACPYVGGVVALMLLVEPRLTASQIEGIIQRTSRPLPGASFVWANDAGFGQLDPEACIAEARTINVRFERTRNRSKKLKSSGRRR